MNFWIFRLDSFGSPFRNVNSGRNTEADALNNERFQKGSEKYLKDFKRKSYLNKIEKHQLDKNPDWLEENCTWLYPAILAPLTYTLLRLYTRPTSLNIRKIGVLVTSALGYQIGARHQVKQENLFLLKNYHLFDKCFRDALETGDARYLVDYWREGDSK